MEELFETQIMKYNEYLYTTALRLCKNTEDAEDLMQETYIKAVRFQDSYQEGTNLKAWLSTILRTSFINEYRKKVRERDRRRRLKLLDTEYMSGYKLGREGFKDFDFLVSTLKGSINAEFLEVLLWVDVHDMSYREVAEVMDLPIGTVMSRLSRARKQARACLLSSLTPKYLGSFVSDDSINTALEETPYGNLL